MFSRRLLEATFASLRCQELLDSGDAPSARLQYAALRSGLRELSRLRPSPTSAREVAVLERAARRLEAALASASGGST